MKKRRKWILWIIIILAAVSGVIFVQVNKVQKEKALLGWLDQEEYQGIWCFMHEMPGYSEENYLTYIGKKIIQRDEPIKKLKDISKCMDEAFLKQPELSAVYLQLDPEMIWKESSYKQEKWQEHLENYLMRVVDSHPETKFDILLPHPELAYWTQQKEEKINEAFTVYSSFVQMVESRGNVRIFFLGDQEWLICNQDNYDTAFQLNEPLGKHVYLTTFCDGEYQVRKQGFIDAQNRLRERINKEKSTPTEYPDLSEYVIVFLGDSIFAIDRKTTSIPGVVKALSGASVYNVGQGGLTATSLDEGPSFLTKVNALASKQIPDDLKELDLAVDLENFLRKDLDGKKLLFVINYGLNDYFQGQKVVNEQDSYDIGTYAGAMRKGITMLQQIYPQAEVIVMGATYTADFSEGNEYMSEHGGRLMEYIDTAGEVAKTCGVYFKNCYEDLQINSQNARVYMQDSCHPNSQGRFVYGKQLIDFIEKSISKND